MNEQHLAPALLSHTNSGIDPIQGVVEYHGDDRQVTLIADEEDSLEMNSINLPRQGQATA